MLISDKGRRWCVVGVLRYTANTNTNLNTNPDTNSDTNTDRVEDELATKGDGGV